MSVCAGRSGHGLLYLLMMRLHVRPLASMHSPWPTGILIHKTLNTIA